MAISKRIPTPPRGRIAKARFGVAAAWKVLRATFAAGAVKGATKARVRRTDRRRRIPILAGAGAALAAAYAAGRKHAKATAPSEQSTASPQPFPDRPPLRAAGEGQSSDLPDPSVQSLSDG